MRELPSQVTNLQTTIHNLEAEIENLKLKASASRITPSANDDNVYSNFTAMADRIKELERVIDESNRNAKQHPAAQTKPPSAKRNQIANPIAKTAITTTTAPNDDLMANDLYKYGSNRGKAIVELDKEEVRQIELAKARIMAELLEKSSSDPRSIINIRFDSNSAAHLNQCINHFIATDFATLLGINIIETITHGPGSFTVKCATPTDCKYLTESLDKTYETTVSVKFAEERHAEIKLCNIGSKYPGADFIDALMAQLHVQNPELKNLNGLCTEIIEIPLSDGTTIYHAIIRFPDSVSMRKIMKYQKLKFGMLSLEFRENVDVIVCQRC